MCQCDLQGTLGKMTLNGYQFTLSHTYFVVKNLRFHELLPRPKRVLLDTGKPIQTVSERECGVWVR